MVAVDPINMCFRNPDYQHCRIALSPPEVQMYIMPFRTSHFSSSLLIWQFWRQNRSIMANLETFLWHFLCNVKYLAWPDPRFRFYVNHLAWPDPQERPQERTQERTQERPRNAGTIRSPGQVKRLVRCPRSTVP